MIELRIALKWVLRTALVYWGELLASLSGILRVALCPILLSILARVLRTSLVGLECLAAIPILTIQVKRLVCQHEVRLVVVLLSRLPDARWPVEVLKHLTGVSEPALIIIDRLRQNGLLTNSLVVHLLFRTIKEDLFYLFREEQLDLLPRR